MGRLIVPLVLIAVLFILALIWSVHFIRERRRQAARQAALESERRADRILGISDPPQAWQDHQADNALVERSRWARDHANRY